MKAIIIEDEQHSIDLLVQYLSQDFPELDVVGAASSVINGKALIEKTNPDLVFWLCSWAGK
ncbi:MAG: hypothetical protein FJZ75_01155 [Bacteroidetes bacterium]|nr:hypothetical protein [Bacteroidota bacterium]